MQWVVVVTRLDNQVERTVSEPLSKYAAKKRMERWEDYYGLVQYDIQMMTKEEYETTNQ